MGWIKLKDSYPAEFPESIHSSWCWCPSLLEMEVCIVGVWWYGVSIWTTNPPTTAQRNNSPIYLTAFRRCAWNGIVSDSMVERYVVGVLIGGCGVMVGGSGTTYHNHISALYLMVMVTVILCGESGDGCCSRLAVLQLLPPKGSGHKQLPQVTTKKIAAEDLLGLKLNWRI